MRHIEIDRVFTEIKNHIKKGKTDQAIEALELFIAGLNDDDLDNTIVSISSRYSRVKKSEIQGLDTEKDRKELSSIDRNLMSLLRETKQVAVEQASFAVGLQLSDLAKEGGHTIDKLKRINVIIAETKIIELQVLKSAFGTLFPKVYLDKIDQSIAALSELFDTEDISEELAEYTVNGGGFLSRMMNFFEEMDTQKEDGLPPEKEVVDYLLRIDKMFKTEQQRGEEE